ncbi:MAG: fasciclin domain-containing protein [Lacibacter sp.]
MKKYIGFKSILQIMTVSLFLMLTACNKDIEAPVPIPRPTQASTPTLATVLGGPNYTFLKAAVDRASLVPATPTVAQQLANPEFRFTVLAPDNDAFIASGIPSIDVINSLPVEQVYAIVQYHILPQIVPSAGLSSVAFPNLQYPTLLNPAPSVSPILRLTSFLSKNGVLNDKDLYWANNIPIIERDIPVVNGMIHRVARVLMPPSQFLLEKINTDPGLTFFKAAIQRADKDVPAGRRIQDALANIGANLTVFAPTDDAFKTFLIGAIRGYLLSNGVTDPAATTQATQIVNFVGPTLFSNPESIPGIGPDIAAIVTPTLAQGIVGYHILGAQSGTFAPPGIRVFSVNIPAASVNVKTLLNAALSSHAGLTLSGNITEGFTVKGLINPTPANIIKTAPPALSSDLNYLNGVLHKIDQVLLPLPLSL